jgi:hypothetical protein
MIKHLRWQTLGIVALFLSIFYGSCRKMPDAKQETEKQMNVPMSSSRQGDISLWDIYQRLPQTIAFNLSSDIKFYSSRIEWIYRPTGLLVRIPTTAGINNWIYAFQPNDAPSDLKVFAVKFFQEAGDGSKFTGKQMWVDLQTWKGYGVSYVNNVPTAFLKPKELAHADWESCMLSNGDFLLNGGTLRLQDEGNAGPGDCGGQMVPWLQRKNILNILGGILGQVFAGGTGSGGSGSGFDYGNTGPDIWIPPSDIGGGYGNGGGGGGSGPDPYEPPTEEPVITPPNQSGSAFNTIEEPNNTLVPNAIADGPLTGVEQVVLVENPTVAFVSTMLGLNQSQRYWLSQHVSHATAIMTFLVNNTPGLTQQQKIIQARNHIEMMISNPAYFAFVQNYMLNNTGMWWANESWLDPYGGLEFGIWAMNFLPSHPDVTVDYLLTNKNGFDDLQGEIDDCQNGGYDNNVYQQVSPNLPWPTVPPVIPASQFIGWGHPGVSRNCMSYAKAQIAAAGYQISGYYAAGQTFQIYTAQNGVNNSMLVQGLSYIRYALAAGIPIIVGIDDQPGSANPQTDNTTDHFIVIVGMGTNSTGKYLQFYDNADATNSRGTSSSNLLYYDDVTGYVQGTSEARYAQGLTYRVTMIRKSKPL